MTKIFFIGDTHFGKAYSYLKDYELNISKRNLDIISNCEVIIKTAIKEKADYVIFLGDLYDRRLISPTIRKIVRDRIFIPLYENQINTIIIGGNHDSPRNLKRGADILELSNFPNVDVYTSFKPLILKDSKIGLLLMPYVHYDVLVEMARDRGMPINQEEHNNIIAQRIIKNYIKGYYESKLKHCSKRILLGHYYLEGAKIRETSTPYKIYGDFKFNKEMVQKELFDLVIFGHIHLRQELWKDNRIIYPGSVERLDMGERDSEKYYCVYDVEEDHLEFRKLECRTLFKFEFEIPNDSKNYTEYIIDKLLPKNQIKESICKVKVSYPKGKEIKINKSELNNYFSDTFYTDIHYSESEGEDIQHLRELNLDPLSLFYNFIEQKYSTYPNYLKLRNIGTEILKKEFKAIDLTTSGPLSIESIDIKNFNNYGKGPNKIIFDQDSYVIKGSTGSGKSSILDAITFALFKRSTRKDVGLNIDQILYQNGHVILDLAIGDKLLTIKRHTRSPKLTLKLDGKPLYQGLSIPEKEQKIQDIIGYDYDGFISSFFIRQQELQIFSDLTSAERQNRLSKLFKLKIFQIAETIAKSLIKEYDEKKNKLEGEIRGYSQLLEELPELEKEFNVLNKEYKKLKTDKELVEKNIIKIERVMKELSPSYNESTNIEVLIKQLEENNASAQLQFQEANNNQTKYQEIQEKLKKFEVLKDQRKKLELRKEELDKNINEKERIESNIEKNTELKDNIENEFNKQINDIQIQIKEISERISIINTDITKERAFNILKTNGRLSERLNRLQKVELPMAIEYNDEKRIKEFKNLQDTTKVELKANAPLQKSITKDVFLVEELKTEKKRLEEKLKEVRENKLEKVKKYGQNIKKFNDLLIEKDLVKDFSSLLSVYKKDSLLLKKKEAEKEKIEKKMKHTQDYSTLLTKLKTDIKEFKEKILENKAKQRELEPFYNRYNENSLLLEQTEETQKAHEKNIAVKATEIKKVKESIDKIKKIKEKSQNNEIKLKLIKEQIEIHEMLQKNIFHLNGVPKFAIEKILPAITIKASKILSDLTDGRLNQIIFRPLEGIRVGFDIFVFDGEQERGASSYSGGEKTQINAAIRFAIMERIAEIPDTAGAIFRKSNTLFIDEGDLGTLDDEISRRRFIDKIFELKSMFKKIILITHLEDVAEQFPNRIKIGRDEHGKSKIF